MSVDHRLTARAAAYPTGGRTASGGARGSRAALLVSTCILALLGGSGVSSAAVAPACEGSAAPVTPYKHVVWIIMENRSYADIVGSPDAPYLNSLGCGQAANYHNITHPSLPNYIAMTSGLAAASLPSTDCFRVVCSISAPSIFGQVSTARLTWGTYAESMPSPCYAQDQRPYVVHHNAPPFYADAAALCPTNDLPYTSIDPNNLPNFSVIIPNVDNDMHDGSIFTGDTWLATNLPPILASSDYLAGQTAVFITWDEGSAPRHTKNCALNTTDYGCHVLTEVIAESVPPNTVSATLFNHYSLLRTTEELLGLPPLGSAADPTTSSMRVDFAL
jgi:phosphatidylinositol-3-phosphatase